MNKISKTELVKKLTKTKGTCTIAFTKKNGQKRVVTGKVNDQVDEQGYLTVIEVLTSAIKKADTRTLCSAIISGEEFICQ